MKNDLLSACAKKSKLTFYMFVKTKLNSSRAEFWINYLFFNIFEKKQNEKVKTIITTCFSMCSYYD